MPAGEEELHSLPGAVDSSEHWLCSSAVFGGDLSPHGEDSFVDLVLAVQMEGSGLAHEHT